MEGFTKKIITTAAKVAPRPPARCGAHACAHALSLSQVQATVQQNLSSAFAPSRPPSEVVDDNVQGILEGLKLLAAPQQDDARRRGRKKVRTARRTPRVGAHEKSAPRRLRRAEAAAARRAQRHATLPAPDRVRGPGERRPTGAEKEPPRQRRASPNHLRNPVAAAGRPQQVCHAEFDPGPLAGGLAFLSPGWDPYQSTQSTPIALRARTACLTRGGGCAAQLEFEARKDVSIIFRNVLQWQQEENLRQTEQQRQESSTAPPSSAPPDPAAPAVPSFSVDFLCEEYDNDHAPGVTCGASPPDRLGAGLQLSPEPKARLLTSLCVCMRGARGVYGVQLGSKTTHPRKHAPTTPFSGVRPVSFRSLQCCASACWIYLGASAHPANRVSPKLSLQTLTP